MLIKQYNRARLTIRVIWGADQVGLLSQRELGDTFVPAFDDPALNESARSSNDSTGRALNWRIGMGNKWVAVGRIEDIT